MSSFVYRLVKYLPESLHNWLRLIRGVWFPIEYEPELSNIVKRVVQPGWVCADVGANIGIITCLLAQIVGPTGRIVSFEAFPKNADMLAKMARWRRLDQRITVENVAVSDGELSELELFPGRGSASAEWNILGHDLEGVRTEAALRVPATSLDCYFPVGSQLNFVKIDVEGAGAFVLRGMRRILQDQRPIFIIEFHDEDEWSARTELFSAGYVLFNTKGEQISQAADLQRIYHCLACPSEKNLHKTISSIC